MKPSCLLLAAAIMAAVLLHEAAAVIVSDCRKQTSCATCVFSTQSVQHMLPIKRRQVPCVWSETGCAVEGARKERVIARQGELGNCLSVPDGDTQGPLQQLLVRQGAIYGSYKKKTLEHTYLQQRLRLIQEQLEEEALSETEKNELLREQQLLQDELEQLRRTTNDHHNAVAKLQSVVEQATAKSRDITKDLVQVTWNLSVRMANMHSIYTTIQNCHGNNAIDPELYEAAVKLETATQLLRDAKHKAASAIHDLTDIFGKRAQYTLDNVRELARQDRGWKDWSNHH